MGCGTCREGEIGIQAAESHLSLMYAPPFVAQFAEVEVGTQTGEVCVNKLVFRIDCGQPINPTHEIPPDGVAPAVVNTIYDAVGVRLREIPTTPERVWRVLCAKEGER